MADEFELGVADYLANPTDPVGPRLKNSLLYGVTRAPDTEAKMRAYSRELGVPLPSVENDHDFAAPQAQVQRLDPNGMILGQPKVADWMSEPANAAIAHDDIPALSALENLARGIGERAASLGSGLGRVGLKVTQNPDDALDKGLQALGVPEIKGFGPNGIIWGERGDASRAATRAGQSAIVNDLAKTDLGYAPGTSWEDVKRQPLAAFIPFAIEQGIVSVPDMLGVLTSLPLYVAGRTGEIGQQRAENDKRQEATVGDMIAAAPAAVASALLERLGTRGILGLDDAVAGGFRAVPKAVAGATLKEGLTEAGQEGVEDLGAAVGTQAGVNLAQIAENMLAAGVAGAGFGAGVRGVTGNIEAVANRAQFQAQQAAQATEQAQTLGDMVNAAQGSALRQRDPQTFKEYLDHVTTDTPAESVYISAADLAATLSQGDPAGVVANAEALKAMPVTMARLQEAMAGNGLVEIPTSELLAYTPDTAMAQSLIENLKVDPNGMSMRQADEYLQAEGEQLKADVGKAVADGVAADAHQASADRVREQLKAQLDTVNRFTPDVNEAYAGLASAFYATTAAELGTTPEDMAASHPLTFQAQGVTDGALMAGIIVTDDVFTATEYRLTGSVKSINGIEYVGAQSRAKGDADFRNEQLLPITGPDAVRAIVRAVQAQGVTDGSLTEAVQLAQMSKDDFAKLLADSRAATAQRKATAAELSKNNTSVRFGRENGTKALVSPDLERPGAWRLTRLDDQGPSGHTEYATKAEAVEDALREKYEPLIAGEPQALQQQDTDPDQVAPEEDLAPDAPPELEQANRSPTPVRLKADLTKAQFKSLRGLLDGMGVLHTWDAAEATHSEMAGQLGIPYDVENSDNRVWVTEEDGLPLLEFAEGLQPPTAYLNSDDVLFDVPGSGIITGREYGALLGDLRQGEASIQARGAYNPSTNTITLLRNADLSTTLHELGHFFLETMARVSVGPDAPARLAEDFATLATFMGHKGISPEAWLALPLEERRDGHELVARGFEAYLRDGKAPSAALKAPFQRFKAWLVHVYKTVAQLRVNLTPEVRGVFDRLLATEEEIAKAETARSYAPLVNTKPEGTSEPEWEEYQRLGAQATADAQDALGSRSIRDMQWLRNTRARIIRKFAAEAREKRKAVKAEVTAEVLAEPVYSAQQYFRRGILNGEPQEGVVHKLKTDEVAAIYEGTPVELQDWRKMGFGKFGMMAEEGLDPDQAAELFGFSSGHELVEALLNAPPMREEIEGRTDTTMMERYGDLKDPASIAMAADEAIHNEARMRFAATEHAMLAKATGQRKMLVEAARDFARDLIGRQRIRDLKPAKYTGAETRAAVAAEKAAGKGDLVLAATEKRNQIINGYAAKAAFEAQDAVAVAMRYLARFESAATRKGMDPDYRDQIDAMLERFDLRTGQTLKAIDKRKSLKSWIEAQQAKGLDPIIDEKLENEAYRKHYKDLTVDELKGLVDAVKNIAHFGRLKKRLLVAADGRAFQAVVDDSEKAIKDNAYKTLPPKLENNTVGGRLLSGFANFAAIHRKFASLVREMEGFKNEGGILWRAFIKPMNTANDREAAMREQATIGLAGVFKPLGDAKLRRKLFIPEIGRSLSLEGRLAVALNWGNELNRARIMDGDKWNSGQVEAILRTLTPEQLGFVNAAWEYLDTYWPQIAAKERRVTGVEPAKVEAEPFVLETAAGPMQMRGGYYPIKYDTERSSRSESDEIAEAVKASLRGAYTRATTRRGHTKARVEKVERPVRKDFGVMFQHVNQVIHDLAFHEYLIDANRLISAPQIDGAIRDHYGVEVLRTIKNTLEDMAEGDAVAENSFERSINYLRSGSTIAGLGWNLANGLLQPLGLSQSIVRIGPKYVAKGIGRAFTDAVTLQNTVKEIGDKSDFMRLRAKTMMREISEVQNQVKDSLKPKAWGPVEASFFMLIQKMQLIADVPTWLGAYEKAQAGGHDDATAVSLADQAVRDSQGSGQTGDLAQIQRGHPLMKLWTSFYSFFSVGYNQLAESVAETRRVGPSRLPLLAADFMLVAIIPSVMGELLKHAMRGDEWDWEELGPQLAKAQLGYLLGFMVGTRDLGNIVQSDGRSGGGGGLRFLSQDLPRAYQQARQGEFDDAARKAFVTAAGPLFHIPAGQINRTWDGIEALAKGETDNPMAVFAGAPKKE